MENLETRGKPMRCFFLEVIWGNVDDQLEKTGGW